MIKTSIRATRDNVPDLLRALKNVEGIEVYVGIPEDRSRRKVSKKVNNATLCFIHTNGSQLRGIPPRPIIGPSIEARGNKEPITDELALASKATLEGKPNEVFAHLRRAGMLGQNAARGWFTDPRNGWLPNAPATIARKLSKLSEIKRAQAGAFLEMGGDSTEISKPLIDTAQLVKAITYVVAGEEGHGSQVGLKQ